MSYSGFGIQSMNSFRRPRQAFKPIFEQFAIGEHPTKLLKENVKGTWREFQEHLREREMKSNVFTSYIYLSLVITVLVALLAAG